MRVIVKEKIEKIILATGSEELNNAIIEYTLKSEQDFYNFEQVHYREFLLEDYNEFDTCIISKILPGEIEYDKLIYQLKRKNVRVILILIEESKEELEICIKYHISDVLIQPVKPLSILDTIKNPRTFKDIEFIYKKLELSIDINVNGDDKNKIKKDEKYSYFLSKNIFEKRERPVKEVIKEKLVGSNNNIGIVGLSPGAGASFIALT